MFGRKGLPFAAPLSSTVMAVLLFPRFADAHPGPGPHGLVDATMHLLTSPDHLSELIGFGTCCAVIAVVAAVVLVRRRRG
jgi:hydrogenase/urease accessory protein HupE